MIKKKFFRNASLLSLIIIATIFFFQTPIKSFIRDQIPPTTYSRISWIKNIIIGKDFGFYKYETRLAKQYDEISKYVNETQFEFSIKLTKKNDLNIFQIPPFFPAIGVVGTNTAYIDFYDNDLIYTTKNGVFFHVRIDNNMLHFKPIKTNISEFLEKKIEEKNATLNSFNPYTISKVGVKDIFVDNNIIYVSYIESNNNGGYNTSILKAEILDQLNFTKFYSPKNFISSSNKEFNPVQSGGRIVNYKKDSLLFSIGEFRDRTSAQNLKTDNGKIIAINKKNSNSRIISMGHRNPQGLDYSKKFDYVISSEHGPAGGDEVNLNINPEKVKNFGWPISSYGNHYDIDAAATDSHNGDPDRFIRTAPLYKNHSDHGFTEPLIYWNINPAVSEIKLIKENINNAEFILASLGNDNPQRPDYKSLLHYKFNLKTNETELIRRINVNERVRDIAYQKNSNRIYYVGESTGVIGLINLE
jgi:glucose/arabinose dehydrogenase